MTDNLRLFQRLVLVASLAVGWQSSASSADLESGISQSSGKPKIGVALGGGGTRGCAHIGALRVLEREGIKVDYIAGVSIGAIVGGLYASGVPLDRIEEVIVDKKLLHSYDTVPIPVRLAVIPVFFIPHIFGHHPYDGLYKGNKFASFINKTAGERQNIETFPIPFCAVASNLLDGKAYSITQGNLGKAVQASSALPFLRRPVDHQGKLFVDGGVVQNLPCQQVRDMGADLVIAIDIDDCRQVLEKKDFRKIGSALNRAINMHLTAVDESEVNKADIVIRPDIAGIKLLSTRVIDANRATTEGEKAAQAMLPAIKEKLRQLQDGESHTQAKRNGSEPQ